MLLVDHVKEGTLGRLRRSQEEEPTRPERVSKDADDLLLELANGVAS